MENKKIVFIDRDGVIIVERNYAYKPEDLEFIPGSIEAMKALAENGFELAIVSNQSGIGRGYFTLEDYNAFTAAMLRALKERGVAIGSVQYCPHHPTKGLGIYKIDCVCRKPKTGMFEKAAVELGLDAKGAWLIGDKTTDIKAGRDFGCRTILVKTGFGGLDKEADVAPDNIAEDLEQAALIIIENEKRACSANG